MGSSADFDKKNSSPFQFCWLDFFKMRSFNWIPEAMIGDKWRPLFPNCGRNLRCNEHRNPPRLIFDQYDNYWLNSPTKYICQECGEASKDCVNPLERKKSSFNSTSHEIMQQIESSFPELIENFPCHISFKNAIDKKLMNNIIHSAVKGIVPSAIADCLVSWHELE